MAARSVTVAALQYRPRQAVLVVVLSAVVTAAAVLGPLYARSVEQSLAGQSAAGPLQLLAAVFFLAWSLGPLAMSAAMRISVEG